MSTHEIKLRILCVDKKFFFKKTSVDLVTFFRYIMVVYNVNDCSVNNTHISYGDNYLIKISFLCVHTWKVKIYYVCCK